MLKICSTVLVAGMMTVMMTPASQAQESQVFRRMTAGQAAPLHGSMTEAQARKACQVEFSGARESKASLNTKMRHCMSKKMLGTE